MIINQNVGVRTSVPKALDSGDSPGNSPPRPNRAKLMLARIDKAPRIANAERQLAHLRNNSAINGLIKNARFGASSCTAIALPQCARSTSEVIVAIADGM